MNYYIYLTLFTMGKPWAMILLFVFLFFDCFFFFFLGGGGGGGLVLCGVGHF